MIISKLLGAGLIPTQPGTSPDAAAAGAEQIGQKGKQFGFQQPPQQPPTAGGSPLAQKAQQLGFQQPPQQPQQQETGVSGIKKKLGMSIFKNFAAGGLQ